MQSASKDPESAELMAEDSADTNPRRKTIGHLVDDGNSRNSFDKADQEDQKDPKEKADDTNEEGRKSEVFEKAPSLANDKNLAVADGAPQGVESKPLEESSPSGISKRVPVTLEERHTANHVVSFTENNDTEEESLRVTIVSEKDSKKNRKSKPQIMVSSLIKPQTGYGQSMVENNGADTLGYDEQSHRRAVSNHYGSNKNLNFGQESRRVAETTPKFDYTKHSLMQMDDVDFDELLECAEENIESSAFFASSM